jgi:tetratricopeptide (TPR) repeat protein
MYKLTDRLQEAEQAYDKALPVFRLIDDRTGEANTLTALGGLYMRTNHITEAERSYKEALHIFRIIHARHGEANTLRDLGELYMRTNQLTEAELHYKNALHIFRAMNARLGEANTLQGLGLIALAKNDISESFSLFLNAAKTHHALGETIGEMADHAYLARTASRAGRWARAIVLSGKALRGFNNSAHHFGRMIVLTDLAQSLSALEQPLASTAALYLAWNIARTIEDPSAAHRAEELCKLLPDFDPTAPTPPELLADFERCLDEALTACETRLRETGEDPYSPVEPAR